MRPPDERLMRARWESEAAQYALERKWSPVDAKVLELLDLKDGDRLLEIGFGSGVVAAEIMQAYPHIIYHGVDYAQPFLRVAKEKLSDWAHLARATAFNLPFYDDSFHHILEMDAIHHFPREYIPGVVQKIAGLLKTGGRLVMAEDWGAVPTDERQKLILSLQSRRYLTRLGLEYHPKDEEWLAMFENAELNVAIMEHVARPLDFKQFENLEDPEAADELDKLRRLWAGDTPTTPMTIFVCKRV